MSNRTEETEQGAESKHKVDPLLCDNSEDHDKRRSSSVEMTDDDIYAGYGNADQSTTKKSTKNGSVTMPGKKKKSVADEDDAARQKALGNSKGEFGDFADEDEESEGCCMCFTAEEQVEEEWRTVSLRFGTNTSPAPEQRGSVRNAVFTAKYTLLSFLPKGIFEQFRRVANIYFLIISVLMALGTYVDGLWYSSLDPWTTIGPLMLIVTLTLMKEGMEDSKRHKADHAVNTRKAKVLCFDGSTSEVAWGGLQPGMVVLIEDRGEFPADLVPLVSSEEEGKCYIETANIDGETNLKLRTAAMGVNGFKNVEELLEHQVSLSFEPPSASIHSFSATLDAGKKGKAALGPVELLLRGAVLRNSKWIMGVIVYTGFETKLVMNSREQPSKLSTVEQMVNQMIYCILFAMVVLTSLTTMGYGLWNMEHDQELWYLCRNMRKDGISDMFSSLCEKGSWSEYPLASLWPTFFILYNNFLPISLYVTVELVNVAQAYFVNQDQTIYHEEQDTPALARTSNMNGDLGQIEYVFSDKTGTLTCNEMKFRRCSVGTRVYGAPLVESKGEWSSLEDGKAAVSKDPVMNHFAQLLATCHNVVVEDGKYMAESPDEEALVDGGASLGLKYTGQTGDRLSISVGGQTKNFTLLATVPFDSARKRMSVLVKDSSGTCWLYCKGADNVMFDRTAENGFDVHCGGKANLDKQLEVFAAEGLRTLVLGYRKLSSGESSKWCNLWKQATESVTNRDGDMENAAAKLELDLILLGCTGIEDRLQDGVPDAIANIKKAGIKVWVLTGDKMTTAIEIGLSCKLLTSDLDLIMLEKDPPKDSPHFGKSVGNRLGAACRSFLNSNQKQGLGLVVDGPALTDILSNDELKQQLLDLACSCVAVVACRVSPAQKQLIVKMVKDGLPHHPITLSIGDGANDVPMIQEAQIGVGISGKEGRQAVNSSDFAIAQFRYLETLLLVHGRWNYRRISKVIVYSFYKNIVLTIVLAWWTNDCGYSGQSLYESYVYSGYNFFLGMPILLLGIFDQDVTRKTAHQFQKLYYIGLEKCELNVSVMVVSFFQACLDAAVIYYLSVGAFNGPTLAGDTGAGLDAGSPPQSVWGSDGESLGLYVFGTAVFTNMVAAMLMKVALMHASWNWTALFGIVFSIVLYTGFVGLYGSFRPDLDNFSSNYFSSYDFYYAPQKMVETAGFWLSLLAVPSVVFAIDLMIVAVQSEFFTSKTRSAREVEAFNAEVTEEEYKEKLGIKQTPVDVEMSNADKFVIDEI